MRLFGFRTVMAGRVIFAITLLAVFFVAGSPALAEESWWDRLEKKLTPKKEPKPAEELFKAAEENYRGKETWLGKAVRKQHGDDSWLYKNGFWITRRNEQRAMELYQELVDNHPFSKYAPISELRIADCHFALENWEEARIFYEQFIRLHPRHEEVPYAMYRQGLSLYNQALKPGRDQEKTKEAVKVLTLLVDRYPDSQYREPADKTLKEARTLLAKHELKVADFYLKRKEYWSAAARYRGVYTQYGGLGFDSQAMYGEGASFEGLDKSDRAAGLYSMAVQAADNDDYVKKARARLVDLGSNG